ncbi:DegT/DnrJ/EryC1/StrS family aminotransferase [Micromonospora sp. WMMA1949]|uniref:DegT/DnrJ/EryC1/StrS family aminotransferase n=1 Tax=unclassified Micromonospora TaxID=2617518 RepID=UPI0022B63346|nr:DegT/DnrJ/EryC1/StrS family aminotransferase [Micromonospora sp. WMMA1949]MCZ7428590.1 DegT/DnrJ/EryC1/StrS family aminotransferase [Micromonospora sp. WMMA1949]
MDRLAMFGGSRTVVLDDADRDRLAWPIVTDAERGAVGRVLDGGGFTSVGRGAAEVESLEREWAEFTGAEHCAAVSSGTAALELALAAADLPPGAEVVVPALSFVATASAPAQRLLVPVFADIDPVTYTLDPAAVAAAITPRTAAIVAVHLHGLPCDMAALRALADRHGLFLLEDAAQAHGATWAGRNVGTLGDAAAFSLNASKNLPTCGEGGLVTTGDPVLNERLGRLRQFGERPAGGGPRRYISEEIAGNAKLAAVQAAFARCQLARFAERRAARAAQVAALLDRLAALPGLVVPECPPDRTHAWHMLRLRIDPAAAGHAGLDAGALRAILQRALRAEGVPVQPYQSLPLPGQPALRDHAAPGGYPWRLPGVSQRPYRAEDHPVTVALIDRSFTLQRWHLNPAAGPVLRRCADAFEKVWHHLDRLATVAALRRTVEVAR